MKKIGALIICLLVFNFLAITVVKAQPVIPISEDVDPETGLPEGYPKNYRELENETETKAEYLKKEWSKILENTPYINPVIEIIDDIFTSLNPFLKIVLGVEYSLSWAFFFAIAIWTILFIFLFPPISQIFGSKLFGAIASVTIASLIGISGVIKSAVDLLSTIINNKWIFWLSLFITIAIGIIIAKFGGGIKEIIEEQKEKSEKRKTKKAQEKIQTAGEVAEEELESYKDTN